MTPPAHPVRLAEVLIDDRSWDALEPARRHDLATVIDDLLAESHFDVAGSGLLRLLVTSGRERMIVGLSQLDGHLVAQSLLDLADLEGLMREYVEVCRRLADVGARRDAVGLEALDITKRLIHDEGGGAVGRACSLLRPDHATARKLFTLVVALHHDATQL